jgi:hypothetical protein
MQECDGFFEDQNIPYESAYEDEAVRAVWVADFYDPAYKKWLILCWFDVTYGEYNGARFDLKDSRVRMSAFLTRSNYATFEELWSSPTDPTLRS